MTSVRLSQVRRRVAGSLANAFQKLLIQSVLRVALMSSKTARTSAVAALSSISGTAGISLPLNSSAAQLAADPASEKEAEHAEIAQQRPDRMGKGFGTVALERGMRQPRRPITDHRSGDQPTPVGGDRGGRDAGEGARRGEIMQDAGAAVGMAGEIARREFLIGHRVKPSLQPSGMGSRGL